jgi:hypothetical protein
MDQARLLEHVHGHLGWLAAALLIHPAILLRRLRRRAHLAVALSASLVTLVGAAGVSMYSEYGLRIRQSLFLHAPRYGWLFERKEHLAFGAIALVWAGAAAYAGAERAEGELYDRLRVLSFRAFAAAAALAVIAAALGTAVAVYKSF